jgi:hypothetical protein
MIRHPHHHHGVRKPLHACRPLGNLASCSFSSDMLTSKGGALGSSEECAVYRWWMCLCKIMKQFLYCLGRGSQDCSVGKWFSDINGLPVFWGACKIQIPYPQRVWVVTLESSLKHLHFHKHPGDSEMMVNELHFEKHWHRQFISASC